MKHLYTYLLCCIFLATTFISRSQSVNTVSFMRMNPYSSSANPAAYTPYKGYLGFPGFGNLNVSLTNSGIQYRKLFKTNDQGYPVTLTANKFIESLKPEKNWINVSLNEEILGFGFRVWKLFFTFSYGINAESFFKYSQDVFAFPVRGNANYLGDHPANLNMALSTNVYQNLSFGIQAEIGKRISIGIRPRLLIGIANLTTNTLNAKIYTDPDDYSMKLSFNADAALYSMIPFKIGDDSNISLDYKSIPDILFGNKKNLGFALDAGALVRINDHFGVGVSVADLGYIKWKVPGVRFTGQTDNQGRFGENGQFFFDGLSSGEIIGLLDGTQKVSEFLDTLKRYFPYELSQTESKKLMLHAKIGAEVYYQINPKHRFTINFQGVVVGKQLLPRLTIAYNANLVKVFDLCIHYSYLTGSAANLGVGVGFNLWPIYLYVATDDLISAIDYLNGHHLSVQAGLVFKWGKAPQTPVVSKKKAEAAEAMEQVQPIE